MYVTHDSAFHADDVLAAAILVAAHGVRTQDIIRTRDPAIIAAAEVAFDVGNKHCPNKGQFDHHQRGGAGARPNGVPYSSAGLIWENYGRAVLWPLCPDFPSVDKAWAYVDERLVQPVDMIDCGFVNIPDGVLTLSAAISALNPSWDGPQDFDGHFVIAVDFMRHILGGYIDAAIAKAIADGLAATAVAASKDGIVILDRFHPWQDIVCADMDARFVVFPDVVSGTWRVQAVPVDPGSFISRLRLPAAWGGLHGPDIDVISGALPGAVFCHINGFIAGHETKEGAISMAQAAMI